MKVFSIYDIDPKEHEDYKKRPKQEIFWDELEKTLKKMEVSPLYQSFKQFPLMWKILGTLRFHSDYNCPDVKTNFQNDEVAFQFKFVHDDREPYFTVELTNPGTVKLLRTLSYYDCYDFRTGKELDIPWEIPDTWPAYLDYRDKECHEEILVEKTFPTFTPALFVRYL